MLSNCIVNKNCVLFTLSESEHDCESYLNVRIVFSGENTNISNQKTTEQNKDKQLPESATGTAYFPALQSVTCKGKILSSVTNGQTAALYDLMQNYLIARMYPE